MKWKTNRYLYLPVLFALGFLYSCEKETIKPIKVETALFSKDIVPIFTKNCISCHAGSRNPDLRADKAYNSLKTGGYYNLTTPADSKLVIKLNTTHIDRANDLDRQKILLWITKGAKND